MIKLKTYTNPDLSTQAQLVKRPAMDVSALREIIEGVFAEVSSRGDEALREYTEKFDGVALKDIHVSAEEIQSAADSLDPELKESIQIAYGNIKRFHESQQLKTEKVTTISGVTCWQESRAIDKVGLYIPGGTAPLFSTVLMLAIPAQIAGCEEIILCTPPSKNGSVNPAILYTAQLCGVTAIYKVGGSQAIAAMVTGTESVPSVYKIFGPGNQYVTAAKMKALDYGVAIDLPAGPSEVLVFADESADPAFVASDLLSQAEHGVDSQVVLVTTAAEILGGVETQIAQQLEDLPRRDIAAKALENSFVVVFDDDQAAYRYINYYAPEHFIISSDEPDQYIAMTQNAGSVFLGHMTPESAGDYASGTNHTLPTSAYARSYSGVSLDSFMTKITFQKITDEGMRAIGPVIIRMAEEEQLEGHANAVRLRMNKLNS